MAVRLDPQEVAEQALGGSAKPGAAEAAARVMVALSEAGWRLVHQDEPGEVVRYGRRAPNEEPQG